MIKFGHIFFFSLKQMEIAKLGDVTQYQVIANVRYTVGTTRTISKN